MPLAWLEIKRFGLGTLGFGIRVSAFLRWIHGALRV